jgi:gliding motility-associated protein GldE
VHSSIAQDTTALVILLIALVIFLFAVSGSQIAFSSLDMKDVNMLKTKSQPSYKRILELLEKLQSLLGALSVSVVVLNIAIIFILNFILTEYFLEVAKFSIAVLLTIKTIIIFLFLFLTGETLPKLYAATNPIRFAKDFGIFAEIALYLFGRPANAIVGYAHAIEKALFKKKDLADYNNELNNVINVASHTSASEEEKEILKGVIKFNNVTVKQVMRTRMDVNGIDYEANFDTVIKTIVRFHHSRLPVYKNDLDQTIGLLYAKDLLPLLNEPADYDWHSLIRPPYFVHEHKMAEELLKEFQEKHIHFAVVVDEFGGTSGIVTMQNIQEEIIGEMGDRFDEDMSAFKKIDDYNYILDGKTLVVDACKMMELPLDTFDVIRGESESIAGLVLEIAGEIPGANEPIFSGDFKFTVLKINRNRLERIMITISFE